MNTIEELQMNYDSALMKADKEFQQLRVLMLQQEKKYAAILSCIRKEVEDCHKRLTILDEQINYKK